MRRVILFVGPGVEILDIAGPAQVFHEAQQLGAAYQIVWCATAPRMATNQGVWLADLAPLPPAAGGDGAPFAAPDLIVVPGLAMSALASVDPAVFGWLRAAHAAGAHLAAVCTGAFLLGLAGLLDGRQCTTHWSRVEELQRRWPAARVLDDRLFVTDDRVTTSAGIVSGIDMALSVVEAHHGPRLAAAAAREMVVYLRRDGTQGQHSVYLAYRSHLHPGVHRVQDWLVAHPAERITLPDLARLAAMSPRHLTRVFRQATGISIHEFTTRLRLERAGVLLHDPSLTLEAVAARCGFASARQLRRRWHDTHGAPPSTARRQPPGPAPAPRRPPPV